MLLLIKLLVVLPADVARIVVAAVVVEIFVFNGRFLSAVAPIFLSAVAPIFPRWRGEEISSG